MTCCCFSRTPNYTVIDPANRPIRAVQPVCVAFGIRGAARSRRYDESLIGRGDLDWTLRTLRDDRAVYADTRFFFANGRIFGGAGGNVDLVDQRRRIAVTREIKRRWGRCVLHAASNVVKNRTVVPMRINVARSNPTAVR